MKCKVCGYKSKENQEVCYFRFPKEKARCQDWAERCGLKDLLEKYGPHRFYLSYKICSNHFKPKDMITENNKIRLLPKAVPQIFSKKRSSRFIPEKSKGNYKLRQNETIRSTLEVNNLKNLCRLCARKKQNMIHMLSSRGKNSELEEKLKYLPLVIDKKDGLPLSICCECISQVNHVYFFIIKCIKAEAKLKSQLEPKQEKSKACKSSIINEKEKSLQNNNESVPKLDGNVDELTVPNTVPVVKDKVPRVTIENLSLSTKSVPKSVANVDELIVPNTLLDIENKVPAVTLENNSLSTESIPKSDAKVDELTLPNTPPVIKNKIPIVTIEDDSSATKENDSLNTESQPKSNPNVHELTVPQTQPVIENKGPTVTPEIDILATKESVSSDIIENASVPVKQNLPSGIKESAPSVIQDAPLPVQQVSMIVTQENADVKNNFLVTITENASTPVITSVPLVVRETTFLVITENVPLGAHPKVPIGMNPDVSLAMNPNLPLATNPNPPLTMKSNDSLNVKENALIPVKNPPSIVTKRNPAVTKNTFFAAKKNLPSAMKKNILLTTKENFPSAMKKNVFTASKQRAQSSIRDNASSVIKQNITPAIKDSNPSVIIDFHTSVIRRHFSKTDSIATVKTKENKKNEVPVIPSNMSDTNQCCELNNSIETFQRVCVIKRLSDQDEYSGSSQQNQITKTIETEIPAQNLYSDIKYSCEICSETFMRIENLNLHMVTHFPRFDESQSFMTLNSDYRYFPHKPEAIIRRKNLVHTCHICFKKFILAAFLKKHIEKYHYGSNLRSLPDTMEDNNPMKKLDTKLQIKRTTLKCQFCDKIFANRQLCKSHEQRHTGKEPYLCEECGKNFKSCPTLRKHMILHSDKSVFSCKDCGKRFKRSDNFAINMRNYTKQYA